MTYIWIHARFGMFYSIFECSVDVMGDLNWSVGGNLNVCFI